MPRVPYKNLTQSDEMAEKLEMSTAEIGLSVRTTNCLEEKGIFTVHDLLKAAPTSSRRLLPGAWLRGVAGRFLQWLPCI